MINFKTNKNEAKVVITTPARQLTNAEAIAKFRKARKAKMDAPVVLYPMTMSWSVE
jgi:hypothetical protein